HRLAGARRRHDDAALAFAQRRDEVDDARRQILLGGIVKLERQLLLGIERRQIVKIDAVAELVRLVEIDLVDLEQREIALAILGRTDLPFDGVAGPETEAADLARAHIDVVRARQVIGFGRAQEAEAVLQHFEYAVAIDRLIIVGEGLQDREHHVLLAERGRVLDLQLLGKGQKLRRGLAFEFLEVHRKYGCLRAESRRPQKAGRIAEGTSYPRARPKVSFFQIIVGRCVTRSAAIGRPYPYPNGRAKSNAIRQKGFTTTRMTMARSRTVGISLTMR